MAHGQLEWKKVSTYDNPADILTMPTPREELRRRLALVRGVLHEAVKSGGNASDVQALQAWSEAVSVKQKTTPNSSESCRCESLS